MADARIFSGIQPTGRKHLGNYIGAIRQYVEGQDRGEAIYCIVDLHAVSVAYEPAELRERLYDTAAILIAAGLDPERCILFRQSDVREHTELTWLLSAVTAHGDLNRMHQFKEKSSKQRELVSAALFLYPVLQAADVLLYRATHVPIGEDQKQHIELARDIAVKFNNDFDTELFVAPEPYIGGGAAARVMSLRDGSVKMSKSDPSEASRIQLTDSDDAIAQKIRKAKTDPEPLPDEAAELDGRPEAKNLVGIYAAVTGGSVESVLSDFAGQGFGAFKPALADALVALIAPLRQRLTELRAHPDEIDRLLAEGAAKARALGDTKIS